jgi:hypothetical protein
MALAVTAKVSGETTRVSPRRSPDCYCPPSRRVLDYHTVKQAVGYLTEDQYRALVALARTRRWTVSKTIGYAVERLLAAEATRARRAS